MFKITGEIPIHDIGPLSPPPFVKPQVAKINPRHVHAYEDDRQVVPHQQMNSFDVAIRRQQQVNEARKATNQSSIGRRSGNTTPMTDKFTSVNDAKRVINPKDDNTKTPKGQKPLQAMEMATIIDSINMQLSVDIDKTILEIIKSYGGR
jgi:hypothetical protein